MKKFNALLLTSSLLAAPAAGALDTETRQIAEARGQAEELNLGQIGVLKLRIVVAKLFLQQLRLNRGLLNTVGAAEQVGWPTITLGFGKAAVEVFAGAKLAEQTPVLADRYFLPKVDVLYERVRVTEATIERQKLELMALKTQTPDASVLANIRELENGITLNRDLVIQDTKQALNERIMGPRARRALRNVAQVTGVGLGLALIADGVATAYQVGYAPDKLEETEGRLLSYISHAEAVLNGQR